MFLFVVVVAVVAVAGGCWKDERRIRQCWFERFVVQCALFECVGEGV